MFDPAFALPERLRRARQLAGLDQRALADAIGIARNTVSNYETGTTSVSAVNFVRWARACGCTLDWLADGIEVTVDNGGHSTEPVWHRVA